MSPITPSTTRRVSLSLAQGHLLYESTAQAARSDLEFRTALDTAREKLADANAVGLWLREDVTVDLEPTEIHAFVEALDVALVDTRARGQDRSPWQQLRQRLSNELPQHTEAAVALVAN